MLLLLFSCLVLSDFAAPWTPGCWGPALHYLLGFAQTHIHWFSDAIQPSLPLSSPSSLIYIFLHFPPSTFLISLFGQSMNGVYFVMSKMFIEELCVSVIYFKNKLVGQLLFLKLKSSQVIIFNMLPWTFCLPPPTLLSTSYEFLSDRK